MDYETKSSSIATAVWEIWTKNGMEMDEDMQFQTRKSALDFVHNSWQDGITDRDWIVAALAGLRCDLTGTIFDKEG